MDPITALGVAGNVVQFIDFGHKLCSTFFDIYQSASGTTKANLEVQMLVETFIDSIDTVSSDLVKYRNALSETPSDSHEQDSVQKIVAECGNVAQELLARIEKLRPEGKKGRWRSFVTAVKSMWKEKDIQDLQARLARLRAELEWIVLISLR
jgi:hypothetical protein